MFASAKKMLVFMAPDDSTSGKSGVDPSTQRAKSTATARRAHRKSSLDSSPPQTQVYTPSRSQHPSSALELLSRSAPQAPRALSSLTSSLQAGTSSKRPQPEAPYYLPDRPVGSSTTTFTKRKYSKLSSRPPFLDRIEEAAAAESSLPSIETTLEAEFTSADAEPSLAKLCRSLLHAAMAVDSGGSHEQRREDVQSSSKSTTDQPGRSREQNMHEGHLSPNTEDLLCVEDIETPGDRNASSGSSQDDPQRYPNRDNAKHDAASMRKIAAAQERSVLQEVSVWLRNITTASLPNGNSSSRQF